MKFSDIKICCFDIDGTLTDGIYQITDKGDIVKSFYTRDFYGIEQLIRNGIKVVILSQSHDEVIYHQINRIVDHSILWEQAYEHDESLEVITCIDNKKEEIEKILEKENLSWSNVAYIGDAENDIESMEKALFVGCPFDAINEISKNLPSLSYLSSYVSKFPGGKGAVYDFSKYILKKIEEEEL